MMDIPDGPGLSNALQDNEPDPTDLVMAAQGGMFYVLRAGTPFGRLAACS